MSQNPKNQQEKEPKDPRDHTKIKTNPLEQIQVLKLKMEHLIDFRDKYVELQNEMKEIEIFKDQSQDELIDTIDELQSVRYHYNLLQNNYNNIANELNNLKRALINYKPIKKYICTKCAFPGHNSKQCNR